MNDKYTENGIISVQYFFLFKYYLDKNAYLEKILYSLNY